MAEYNIPSPKNLFVANKATVWIAKETAADTFAEKRPVGYVDSANFTPDITKLEYKSHIYGLNSQKKNIAISKGGSISVVITELVRDNLIYILGSSARTASTTTLVPMVESQTFASNIITVNSGAAINSVIEVLPQSGEEVYTEGVTGDYTVALATGVITRVLTGDIGATDTVIVLYDVSKTVSSYPIMDDVNIRGHVWVVSAGSEAQGPQRCIYYPMADITLDGDVSLLGKEEYQTATLQFALVEEPTFGYWYQWNDS